MSDQPQTFTLLVSARGFTPHSKMTVKKGDIVDFQPDGADAPTSVAVTAQVDPTALFGTASFLVGTQQKVMTDHGVFHLAAGDHHLTVQADGSRNIIPTDPIKTKP